MAIVEKSPIVDSFSLASLRYLFVTRYNYLCFISIICMDSIAFCGNNFKNNRKIKKEFPERIIGSSKSIIDSPLSTA